MDTLTAAILVVTLLILVAPIIEIAVKRPKTFLEMTANARAFAEAPLHESVAMPSSADVRKVKDAPADEDRVAGSTSRVTAELPAGRRVHPDPRSPYATWDSTNY